MMSHVNGGRGQRRFPAGRFWPLLLWSGVSGLAAWQTRATEPSQAENDQAIAVNREQDLVAVPELRGEKEADAKQLAALAGARFASGVYYLAPRDWRDELRTDRVLMQTPQPGRRVPRGSPVAVWLPAKAGDERPIVETPDVRAMTAREAAAKLEAAGLALLPRGDDAAARVVEQYPAAGKKVYQGTAVYLLLKYSAGGQE